MVAAEVDVLRVHLDTARYQLFAQYPDPDNALLLNCLLLAATEAIVTGDLPDGELPFRLVRGSQRGAGRPLGQRPLTKRLLSR